MFFPLVIALHALVSQAGSMIQARVEVVRPCQVGLSSLAVLFLLSTEHG